MTIPKELLTKYHMNTLEGYKEDFKKEMSESDIEKMFCETFLHQTDHIPLKIIESFVEDMAAATSLETIGVIVNFFKDIKLTYSDVLRYRKQARQEINRLQSEQDAAEQAVF